MTMARKFDIAVSFASEQRPYVEKTVTAARQLDLEVFYDRDVSNDWWGKNFIIEQRKVYGESTHFVVPFISSEYLLRPFPMDEFSAAMLKAVKQRHPYILPVLVGDVVVPAEILHPFVGFLRAEEYTPEELAAQMKLKVQEAKQAGHPAKDLAVVVNNILDLPKVAPATFSKYRELTATLDYLGEKFEAVGHRLESIGFVSTVHRGPDRVHLAFERGGRTEYALRVSVGGQGMGQDKLTFSQGEITNGMAAWAEPVYDIPAEQAKLRLVDFSLLGRSGGEENTLTKEEFFTRLWARIVADLEHRQ